MQPLITKCLGIDYICYDRRSNPIFDIFYILPLICYLAFACILLNYILCLAKLSRMYYYTPIHLSHELYPL